MRHLWRNYNLSIVLLGLFLTSWVEQAQGTPTGTIAQVEQGAEAPIARRVAALAGPLGEPLDEARRDVVVLPRREQEPVERQPDSGLDDAAEDSGDRAAPNEVERSGPPDATRGASDDHGCPAQPSARSRS